MSYMDEEKKITRVMDMFPREMIESGDFDIVYFVVKLSEKYDLVYSEIEVLYKELFGMLTGESDTTFFARCLKEKLKEENKPSAEKIAEEILQGMYEPIKKALGSNFPVVIQKSRENTEGKTEVTSTEVLDRNEILSGIENPQRIIPRRLTDTLEIEAPHTAPKPQTVFESKISSITSLPKKEEVMANTRETTTPVSPKPIKPYAKDPYREEAK